MCEAQSLPSAVFGDIRPNFVVLITANALFNLLLDFQEMLTEHLELPLEQQCQQDVASWLNQALSILPEPHNRKKRNAAANFQLLPTEFQSWCTNIKDTYGYSTFFESYGQPDLKIKDTTVKDLIGHQMYDYILNTTGMYYQVCIFQKDAN